MRIHILPRVTRTWSEFLTATPHRSIALDGAVSGGPRWDEISLRANFDHHDGVVREATMSTAMQVYFAIKGGLMDRLGSDVSVYVNDVDQDTALAVWLLQHYRQFDGVQSHPIMNRLLALNDRWDITGGAFPMSLDDQLVRQHCWAFSPYTDLRKSGALADASETVMRNCLQAVLHNLTQCFLGRAEEKDLDTRHEILYSSDRFKIVDEIGGNEARYYLFSRGLIDAYVSLVARRGNGRFVYTIGRRSQYIDFPVSDLYMQLTVAEINAQSGCDLRHEWPQSNAWGGSDIIGGSPRLHGSVLSWQQVRDTINAHLEKQNGAG